MGFRDTIRLYETYAERRDHHQNKYFQGNIVSNHTEMIQMIAGKFYNKWNHDVIGKKIKIDY
jgi:hypothetical protein